MKKYAKHIGLTVLLLALLAALFPIPRRYKDGGTVGYGSLLLLYEVRDWHREVPMPEGGGIKEGWSVEVLGREFYNNTYVTK